MIHFDWLGREEFLLKLSKVLSQMLGRHMNVSATDAALQQQGCSTLIT